MPLESLRIGLHGEADNNELYAVDQPPGRPRRMAGVIPGPSVKIPRLALREGKLERVLALELLRRELPLPTHRRNAAMAGHECSPS